MITKLIWWWRTRHYIYVALPGRLTDRTFSSVVVFKREQSARDFCSIRTDYSYVALESR